MEGNVNLLDGNKSFRFTHVYQNMLHILNINCKKKVRKTERKANKGDQEKGKNNSYKRAL
jgi:hypothetical protein